MSAKSQNSCEFFSQNKWIDRVYHQNNVFLHISFVTLQQTTFQGCLPLLSQMGCWLGGLFNGWIQIRLNVVIILYPTWNVFCMESNICLRVCLGWRPQLVRNTFDALIPDGPCFHLLKAVLLLLCCGARITWTWFVSVCCIQCLSRSFEHAQKCIDLSPYLFTFQLLLPYHHWWWILLLQYAKLIVICSNLM